MNCKTFENRLEAYLAGDLSPVGRTRMEQHQVACAHCQRLANRATRLDGLLRDGLIAAAAMTAGEQVALRESVLDKAQKKRARPWRAWAPRLAGLGLTLVTIIALAWASIGKDNVPAVSAAEIITRAQAAMDERAGLSGVLHWETHLEQWAPWAQISYETEIWFDCDDPGRYSLSSERQGNVVGAQMSSQMVRDGIDHLWVYRGQDYWTDAPYVDEIILSPDEMQELASWHVPSPFRNDLTLFADMLPDVELVGETTVAGRPAHLLRGQLMAFETHSDQIPPRLATSTVTLTVDAETFWLLGLEEMVEGEVRPRIVYRTQQFEVLSPEQTPGSAFAFTPPESVSVRRLTGMDSVYEEPRLPTMTLPEAAEAAPFILTIPTFWPQDLEPLPHLLVEEIPTETPAMKKYQKYQLIYRGRPGRQMLLTEAAMPGGPGLTARPVDVGGRQGWIESDLIDSRKFTVYLPDWEIAEQYDTLEKWQAALDAGVKLTPGSVSVVAWGISVEEAVTVLESLEPYE